jgi:uncharacterized membrane protein
VALALPDVPVLVAQRNALVVALLVVQDVVLFGEQALVAQHMLVLDQKQVLP